MKKIAVEEHFFTWEYMNYLHSRKECPRMESAEDENHRKIERLYWTPDLEMGLPDEITGRLLDLGEERLRDMDKNGIDMQILSFTSPGVEDLDASVATPMARKINDELASVVQKYPQRFAGFATLAPQDANTAASELERAVKELGFKGLLINSHIGGEYLDSPKYQVILEKAAKLEVPVYIHPRQPPSGMLESCSGYPTLALGMWGFAADVSLHAMRLICSGVFDKYPGLKFILGHLGEALPYWFWRLDNMWRRSPDAGRIKKMPSQYLRENFFVTTSGMFWHPALLFVRETMGVDSILFAVDYPYEPNEEAVQFIDSAPISDDDREKICHLNAEKLLAL